MSQIFSVDQIWELDDTQISIILKAFNWNSQNPLADKLSATILLLNNNSLNSSDINIVSHPEFARLYLLDESHLNQEAFLYGIPISSKPNLIREIIKKMSPQLFTSGIYSLAPSFSPQSPPKTDYHPASVNSVPQLFSSNIITQGVQHSSIDQPTVVSEIPKYFKNDLIIYKLSYFDDKIYLCGNKTFEFRDLIKAIPGRRWDQDSKCWEFPLEKLKLVQDFVNAKSDKSLVLDSTLSIVDPKLNIMSVTQRPKKVKGALGVFQMDNKILVCGGKTYIYMQKLSEIGEGYFDRDIGCWVFPPYKAQDVLDFLDYARQQDIINAQREAQEEDAKRTLEAQEEALRQERLKIVEPEAPFMYNFMRNYNDGSISDEEWDANQRALDSQELEPLWNDKIIVTNKKYVGTMIKADVTYKGDLKPPPLAMALAVSDWWPHNWGTVVDRVDYKKYKVTIHND